MAQTKVEIETVERRGTTETMEENLDKSGPHLMRSKEDELSVWQTARRYKLSWFVAMAAAFSASLDGYREIDSLS
jgi:MFS transporter, SP family, general alpha glucoside:H+ symporter